MDFSNLTPGEEYNISFSLNIAGTSSVPSEVRVCLESSDLKLCCLARLNESNQYQVIVPLIPDIIKTVCTVSIEVLLNGKLLVPYKELVDLHHPVISAEQVEVNKPSEVKQVEPIEEPAEVKIEKNILTALALETEQAEETPKPKLDEELKSFFKNRPKPVKKEVIKPVKDNKIIEAFVIPELDKVEVKKPKKIQASITELKVSKIPFKLSKTKIIEK